MRGAEMWGLQQRPLIRSMQMLRVTILAIGCASLRNSAPSSLGADLYRTTRDYRGRSPSGYPRLLGT